MSKRNLQSAAYATKVPIFEPQQHTAAQLRGLAFEAAVKKRLKNIYAKSKAGPWLNYVTANNRSSICQPDMLIWLSDTHILIIEAKLTWQRKAREKLMNFYKPLIECIHPDATISCLQIFKNTKKAAHKRPLSIYNLDTIKPGTYRECHWLGL